MIVHAFRCLAVLAAVAAPSAMAQYTYGKFLEPPAGYLLQGMGQWAGDDAYATALTQLPGPPTLAYPAHEQVFIAVKRNVNDPHPVTPLYVTNLLAPIVAAGRIPHICIEFYDYNAEGEPAFDHEITCPCDDDYNEWAIEQLENIGTALATYGKPVYCRIGGEFNNVFPTKPQHEYHPWDFPICFQITRDILISKGAKCAFIWTWQANGSTDYLEQNPTTLAYKWYPGDEYVDWFGLDLYVQHHFTDHDSPLCDPPVLDPGDSVLLHVENFLADAHDHGCPVFIETSAADVDPTGILGPDDDENNAIGQWFVPFLEFVNLHPGIKAIDYVNHTWDAGGPVCWADARIANSSDVLDFWVDFLLTSSDPIYLGKGNEWMLNGYYDGWTNLENAHPSPSYAPFLAGTEVVVEGQDITVTMAGAKPNIASALYVGLDPQNISFHGGVLVPDDDAVYTLGTGAGGSASFTVPWPVTTPDLRLYFQFWMNEGAGVWAGTNAILGVPFVAGSPPTYVCPGPCPP